MTGAEAIQLMRYQLGDMQDAVFSPFDKLNAFNAANRYFRRLALEFKPSILNYTETQNLAVGTAAYTLTHKPNRILEIRVAGKRINSIESTSIVDLTKTGTPTNYYMSAYDTITFYPIPDAILAFSVYMVEASTDVTEASTLLWTADLVDLIVLYAVGMLKGSLDLQYIRQEVRKLLGKIEPSPIGVNSYWEITQKDSDY